MPLNPCPDCGRPVSDQALSCPNCGRPTDRPAPPLGGTQRGQTIRPDFWHDPNVGCLVAGIVVLVLVLALRGCP